MVVPSAEDIITLENYVNQGGNLIISGAWLINDYGQNSYTDNVLHANAPGKKYATLKDINITNSTHRVTTGFAQNELINLILSPGGYTYETDVIENVVNRGQTLAVRGPLSLNTSTTSIVAFENASSSARVLFIAFPIFLLDGGNRTKLVENAMKWMDDYAPTVNSINLIPGSAVDIDPNTGINVTANITDIHNVSIAIFEYKCAQSGVCSPGTESWTNMTMFYNSTTNLFENASFTPNSAAIWSYRVWANDTLGNSNYSQTYNLSVQYDYTWTVTNLSGTKSCVINDVCTIGNITINNTGDYDLSFDISSNWIESTVYNDTEPFTLAAGEKKNIIINLTTTESTSRREYPVTITVDATTANAEPDYASLNITFVVYVGGPYLKANIVDYNISLMQGDVVNLTSSVENIGNDTAVDTWLNWTIPIGWTNTSGNLSQFVGNLTPGSTAWNNITVSLSSLASAGTSVIYVNSSCTYDDSRCNNTGSASVSVVISCNGNDGACGAGCTVSTDADCVVEAAAAGGGGGRVEGAAGSGAPGAKTAEEFYTGIDTINTTEEFEVTRGYDNSFSIVITNPYKYAKMHNVTLFVKGYFSQYLRIAPEKYDVIGINESKAFNVTIVSPAYMERGQYPLEFNITSKIIGKVLTVQGNFTITAWFRKELIEKRIVNLFIYEVRREDAFGLLNESKAYFAEMEEAGFFVGKLSQLLKKAESAFAEKQYELTKELSEQIKEMRKDAFEALSLIAALKSSIKEAEENVLKIDETKRLFNLALAAFDREDYESSLQRAKDAQLSYLIETEGKINFVKLIFDYYWLIILSILLISSSAYALRNRMLLGIIKTRIRDLEKEQITINSLIKELQQKTFKDKSLSIAEYHKQMYSYETRISEIRQLISNLRAKRVGIIKISKEIKMLKKEDKEIVDLIKKVQELYFNRQTLTKRAYNRRMEEYKLRRTEIEKSIVILEINLAKKQKLNELRGKEREIKIKREINEKNGRESNEKLKLVAQEKAETKPAQMPFYLAINKQAITLKKQAIALLHKAAVAVLSFRKHLQIFKFRLPAGRKASDNRKNTISKLKEAFKLNKIKIKSQKSKKDYSDDANTLIKHGFKIKLSEKKKTTLKQPAVNHMLRSSGAHQKGAIINHLKEVYKHG